jgi:hypothetical protein
MAVASIAVPPDAQRDAKAALLAPLVGSWPRHTLKVAWGSFEAGTTFRRAYGSKGARYLVNAVACSCPDYQQSQNVCKHIRAYVLWEAATAAASAPQRKGYRALFPECRVDGCTDDAGRAGGLCLTHASEQARALDMATRRALVAS